MPTPTKGPRLGGGPAHERLMLANLATSLFEHDRITTTEAKAKRLRPLAERLITFAKRGDLHARRQVMTRDPRQGRRAQAVRRDRPEVRRPARRLHPHREDRSAQGRQRADGGHRAGRGARLGRSARPSGRAAPGRRPRRRRPVAPRRSPRTPRPSRRRLQRSPLTPTSWTTRRSSSTSWMLTRQSTSSTTTTRSDLRTTRQPRSTSWTRPRSTSSSTTEAGRRGRRRGRGRGREVTR